jgi:hypothetical protein
MEKHNFTIHERKQGEFWKGAITGAMWAFGSTLPNGESFKWWWESVYANFQEWTCTVECSEEMFVKIKEYIDNIIPGTVFK